MTEFFGVFVICRRCFVWLKIICRFCILRMGCKNVTHITTLRVWRPCPINDSLPYPLLDNIQVMVVDWRLRRILSELLRAGLCDTMFTVSSTLIWAVLTGPADWVCHIGILTPCRGGCLELYYWKTMVSFSECFDTVGLVIGLWPVNIVPDMTYNVFGGTLNLAQSINHHSAKYHLSLNGSWHPT